METFNDYSKDEDQMMWEIHEARRGIMNEIETKGIEKFNKDTMDFYANWKLNNKSKDRTSTSN